MSTLSQEAKQLLQTVKDQKIEYIKLEICDAYGRSLGKIVHAIDLQNYLQNGFWSPPIWFFTAEQLDIIYNDTGNLKCVLDLDTYKQLPAPLCLKSYNKIATKMARIMYHPLEKPNDLMDPRTTCIKQINKLKNEFGYTIFSSFEHEFQLFKPSINNNNEQVPCWDGVAFGNHIEIIGNGYGSFMVECERTLRSLGVNLESMHLEHAPGQYEFTMKPSYGIQSPDNSFLYKTSIKQIAMNHGLNATFATTPQCDETKFGSNGCHFNHDLHSLKDGKNVFFDSNSDDKLSLIAKYWIGGILYHLNALTVFAVPTLNCYRRINTAHNWAPDNASYGFDNRMCLIRIKTDKNNPNHCYLEYRLPSSASNPYLILSSILIAGMDGIKNKILPKYGPHLSKLDDPNLNKKYPKIPNSLNMSLNELLNDKVICKGFGKLFIDLYVKLKTKEIELVNDFSNKFGDKNKAEKYLFSKL